MSGKMEVWLLDLGTLYAKQEGIICRGWPQDTSRIHCQSWPLLVPPQRRDFAVRHWLPA